MSVKLQTVHVRVNDAATGKPTPARVRFTDADGTYYAPLGRLTNFATGRSQDVGANARLGTELWAFVDGSFEIKLPSGTIHVKIHKGPEYFALAQTIQLSPGKLALRFTIERWLDLPARGWYSGDGRVHFLSPHAALLEAEAEDVHVVNLLITPAEISDANGKKAALANIAAFSGRKTALETPGCLVVVNTHNTHATLGSLALLNCHRVVYPLEQGGAQNDEGWTMADWCDQCHRKNGLVVWTRSPQENVDFFLGEPLIDLLAGKIDALEIVSGAGWQPAPPGDILALWYDLLEVGITLPLIGSSGKDSNARAMGAMRTYTRLPSGEGLTYAAWIEAVRAGRTFVTTGPMLFLTANNQGPGTVLDLAESGGKVHVRAEVISQAPLQRLEIVVNGTVAAGTENATLEVDMAIAEWSWLAARCREKVRSFDPGADHSLFAHTSPIYLRFNDRPRRANRESVGRLLMHVDRLETWFSRTSTSARVSPPAQLLSLLSAARQKLLSLV